MADNKAITNEKLKERLAQAARAVMPFNPVSGEPLVGANLVRLQEAMKVNGWGDVRFVSKAQARANGWTVATKAAAVEVLVRNVANGVIESVELFNAASVRGMPTLNAMLNMDEGDMSRMRGLVAEDLEQDEVSIAPARELVQLRGNAEPMGNVATGQQTPSVSGTAVNAGIGGVDNQIVRLAVMAPYWLNGLHNFEGLRLAKEINEVIRLQKLERDKAALDRLLAVYPQARDFGIGIVSEQQLLSDPHILANVSEPATLMGGTLHRGEDGHYRSKGAGLSVVQDQGTSLVLKSKGALAYKAAMELALSKGWTAIELTGKKSVLAEAWLEARMLGLNVVNYTPNEKDKEKFAARLAAESERKAEQAAKEVVTEDVEVRPSGNVQSPQMAVPAPTHAVTASAPTMEHEFKTLKNFGPARYLHTPTNNQSYFADLVDKHGEVQTIWGLDIERSFQAAGAKIGDSVALVNVGKKPVEVMQPQGDGTFKAVPGERLTWETYVEGRERSAQQQKPSVSTGLHVGPVMAIQDGRVAQKTGRDPAQVVWHEIAKLAGATPRLGESVEISYANGVGTVATKGLEQEQAAGQRSIGR